jgi:hypothetical protein
MMKTVLLCNSILIAISILTEILGHEMRDLGVIFAGHVVFQLFEVQPGGLEIVHVHLEEGSNNGVCCDVSG